MAGVVLGESVKTKIDESGYGFLKRSDFNFEWRGGP